MGLDRDLATMFDKYQIINFPETFGGAKGPKMGVGRSKLQESEYLR